MITFQVHWIKQTQTLANPMKEIFQSFFSTYKVWGLHVLSYLGFPVFFRSTLYLSKTNERKPSTAVCFYTKEIVMINSRKKEKYSYFKIIFLLKINMTEVNYKCLCAIIKIWYEL